MAELWLSPCFTRSLEISVATNRQARGIADFVESACLN
jgi:hypothetical protein